MTGLFTRWTLMPPAFLAVSRYIPHGCVILRPPMTYFDLRSLLLASIPDGLPLFLMCPCYILVWRWWSLCIIFFPYCPCPSLPRPSDRLRRNASGRCTQRCLVQFERFPSTRLSDSSTYAVARSQSMGWDPGNHSRCRYRVWWLRFAIFDIKVFSAFHLAALWSLNLTQILTHFLDFFPFFVFISQRGITRDLWKHCWYLIIDDRQALCTSDLMPPSVWPGKHLAELRRKYRNI